MAKASDNKPDGEASDPMPRGGRRRGPGWQKGQSGNPGGHPAGYGEFTKAARERGHPKCLDKMEALMDDPKVAPAVQLAAAKELKEWGFGRSVVPVFAGGVGMLDVLTESGAMQVDGEVNTPLLRAAKARERERKAIDRQLDQARKHLAGGKPVNAPTQLLLAVKDEEN